MKDHQGLERGLCFFSFLREEWRERRERVRKATEKEKNAADDDECAPSFLSSLPVSLFPLSLNLPISQSLNLSHTSQSVADRSRSLSSRHTYATCARGACGPTAAFRVATCFSLGATWVAEDVALMMATSRSCLFFGVGGWGRRVRGEVQKRPEDNERRKKKKEGRVLSLSTSSFFFFFAPNIALFARMSRVSPPFFGSGA